MNIYIPLREASLARLIAIAFYLQYSIMPMTRAKLRLKGIQLLIRVIHDDTTCTSDLGSFDD
jgi:hypothetical protein